MSNLVKDKTTKKRTNNKKNVEKPYLINKTFSSVYIYPSEGENFNSFVIPFPFLKKSEIYEEQLKAVKLQDYYLKNKLVVEASEDDLKIFLKKMKYKHSESFQEKPPTIDVVSESPGIRGLVNHIDSIENIDSIKNKDIKSFEDRFLKKVKDGIPPSIDNLSMRSNTRIVDVLLNTAENKFNEMVELTVLEIKANLKNEITKLIENRLTFENVINKIRLSVNKPTVSSSDNNQFLSSENVNKNGAIP